MKTIRTRILATSKTTARIGVCAALVVTACSSSDTDPGTAPTTSAAGSGGSSVATGSGGGGMTTGSGGAGGIGTTDAGAPTAQLVARFDQNKGQLPEGLAIRDGAPYVGFATTSEVAKVDVANGTFTTFANLPKPAPNTGFLTGLAFTAKNPGVLYAALVSFMPETQAGIYQVAAEGGAATLFAMDPAMPFPNGLFADDQGTWFVADSTGIVFRISADGKAVEKWASDDLLVGDKDKPCAAVLPFPVGANGIVKNGDSFYVTNTDKGLIVRIPVAADGKAGKPTVFAGPDCTNLAGADGLTLRGTDLIVAANARNQLVRVGPTGSITTIVSGDPLDFPASVAFDGDMLYVSNFALGNALANKPGGPGLMRIDLTHR